MADQKLSQKSTLTKSTIATNDLVYVADVSASATKGITYQELIQPLDTQFAIADNSDTTKKIAFQASGITTGTTRTLTAPDADTTIVGTDTTQTLTNKTLTSPQINMSSNATGDMYYRNSGGTTVRLPIGSTGQILNADATGIPAWVANPSASDATTTIKGVVELGTQAENDAGTGTPTTTASLIPTIGTIRARLLNTGVVDTGTSTAYAIAPTPAITAYAAYQEFTFKAVNANTTTTPTLNVNSIGAKTITNPDGTALAVGQISANSIQKVVYDGTNFQLVSANAITTKNIFSQPIVFSSSSGATGTITMTNLSTSPTGVSTSEPIFGAYAQASAAPQVVRFEKLNDGSLRPTHIVSVSSAGAGTEAMIVVCGSYVYAFCYTGAANVAVRFDKANLANQTTITVSGTAFTRQTGWFSNDTDLWNVYTAGSAKKYAVSGTTITSGADTSYTSIASAEGAWSDGTYVYQFSTSTGQGYRWAFAGGARTTGNTIAAYQHLITSNTVTSTYSAIFKEQGNSTYMHTVAVPSAGAGTSAGKIIQITAF